MAEYVNNHMAGFWIAAGFVLLAAEVLLFGFTTIIFLFAGIGALITGLLMSTGLLHESWIAGISCFGISTGLSSAVLWKTLKKLQDKSKPEQPPDSDFIGIEFNLEQDISLTVKGQYRYSGVSWSIELDHNATDQTLSKGDRVTVVAAEVGVFKVKKLQ